MLPEQWIPCIFVVIKRGRFPVLFAVAGFALRPKDALVIVVFLMAGKAVGGRRFIPLIVMAVLAFRVSMTAAEGELRFVVIEQRGIFPVLLRVALFAGATQRAIVLVVFLMADRTGTRGITVFDFRLMTSLALSLLGIGMGTFQGKIRLGMIEGRCIDRRNVFCTPFVFGMALPAFPLLFHQAMQSLLVRYVLANILVTVQTELGLCRLVESFVALATVRLPFGMPLDHFARHQRGLDRFSQCNGGDKEGKGHRKAKGPKERIHGVLCGSTGS